MKNPFLKFLLLSGITGIFFALDRMTKIWAETALSTKTILLLGNWLRFKLAYNEHLALSIPFPLVAQIGLSIILLGALVWYFFKHHGVQTKWDYLIISMIFGGALGNLADRIFFGKVVDFIAVSWFPVFNVADTLLFLGIVTLFIQSSSHHKKT